MNRKLKIFGAIVLGVAAAGGIAALIVRDQLSRHQRDLFSPVTFRRLAALGHMARERASVNNINLLRDFLAWERRKLLRSRARLILTRMQRELHDQPPVLQEGTA